MIRIFLPIIAIIAVLLFKEHQELYYHGPRSDHFDGKHFHNLEPSPPKSFYEAIKWKLSSKSLTWPTWIAIPENNKLPASHQKTSITSINHASFLIQTKGVNILTDPIWSKRASPLSFLGPRRIKAPGLQLEELPNIDIITISHNHYDHLDMKTIKQLESRFKPIFIAGLGVCKAYLSAVVDHSRCIELDWWGNYEFKGTKITFVPAKHWSRRKLFDTNKTLWGGFVFSNPHGNIYFVGDTGFGQATEFHQIKDKFKHFSTAIIPIGAYKPEWFMNSMHITPEQAVLIHKIINPNRSIAMEHDVFPMAGEDYEEAPQDLNKAKAKYKIPKNKFITLENGQAILY